ncbi:MAG: 6-bladed beta-propeller [Gemmatimonadaceae bacterium]
MRRFTLLALVATAACGNGLRSAQTASWHTVFDSTGDTIVARTSGVVPNEPERRLVLEQQIGEADGNDSITFGRIQEIAVTSDSRIFVYDGQGPSLKLFDSTGKLVRFVGRKGAGPGEFEQVTGLGILPNEKLAMWDAFHGRVNIYSPDGDYTGQWRVPISGWFTEDGLHTDAAGAIVLRLPVRRDASRDIIGEVSFVRFDSAGVVRDTVMIPRWVDSTPQLAARGKQVFASLYLPFAPQVTYTWNRTGALLSGGTGTYAVYVTHSDRPRRIEMDRMPVHVLPEEADYERARLTWHMRTAVPDWNWSGPSIPGSKPAYSRLLSGEDGRIWVKLHMIAEPVESEDAPIPEPGQPRPPVRRLREPNVYDVFEPSGVYLGRVRVDRRQEIHRMDGDRVWGVLTDSLGVAYVARWRVDPPFSAPTPGR